MPNHTSNTRATQDLKANVTGDSGFRVPGNRPQSEALREARVPSELRGKKQWVPWRYERHRDKDKKVPGNPHTGGRADTTKPETWGSHQEALRAYEKGGYDGIGFVFAEGDPYAGADFDNCRNPETGEIAEWALEWVEEFGGYVEVSPSGTGLHIIVRGTAPNRHNRKAGVEAYSRKRFFTFTGAAIRGGAVSEIPERQDAMDRLCAKFFPPERQPEPGPAPERQPVDLGDEELLQKARTARGGVGERFAGLYDRGDFLDHPSHSEARHELLRHLAFWTAQDFERMARLYEGSALYSIPGYAKKWARLAERECQRAIAASPKAYRQQTRESKAGGGELTPAIEALKSQAAGMAWEGRGGPMDRASYSALTDLAQTYGTPAKKGIMVSADMRTLALMAGTSRLETIGKSIKRLQEVRGLIRLVKKGTRGRGATYLLLYPRAPQNRYIKPCEDYVPVLRELRNPGPTTSKDFDQNGRKIPHDARFLLRKIGKAVALPIEHVANSPGITAPALARKLKRRPDNLSRLLKRVIDAGLLFEDAGRLYVPDNLRWRLETELEESGCNKAKDYAEVRFSRDREGFRSPRERPADEAPTDADLTHQRLERVQDALDALQTPGTGPAKILEDYLSGATSTFEYVVCAVAFYYGSAGWDLWREPVERAVALIGNPREGG